jgi:uncharacterized protein YbbK (DUF523 family)
MDKILISACLLGDKVRYDGEANFLDYASIKLWRQQGRLLSICPEVSGGLSVPRPPAEITNSGTIVTCNGNDVSREFLKGAQQALALCQTYNIKYALLKESSPSCGSTTIYDGSFSKRKIVGLGVTAKLLKQHGIRVFSEQTITELVEELGSK